MSVVCSRLTVFSEESVPLFGPPLPVPPVFMDLDEFRDFLLVKSKSTANCSLCNGPQTPEHSLCCDPAP